MTGYYLVVKDNESEILDHIMYATREESYFSCYDDDNDDYHNKRRRS